MTGTRAEYGLLYWLIRDLGAAKDVTLQLVVSAMHLVPEFGLTVEQIRVDRIAIDAEVPCIVAGDSHAAMGKSIGLALLGFIDAFTRLAPDLLVLLGDRFEVMAAATAATALRIPIAHLHGGEITEGAIDDAFRHAVTKMSHLHFVAATDYARRVVQLGEAPQHVFNVGAIGLDNFRRLALPDPAELSRRIGFNLTGRYLLVTYHPTTLDRRSPLDSLDQLIAALDRRPADMLLITKANADAGGGAINARLATYAAGQPHRVHLASSLGQANYLAALRGAAAVVGNSSSGIIEAPAADVPTVNIGSRQTGRLRAASVIDCPDDADAIESAVARATSESFRAAARRSAPPYGRPGDAASRIVAVICETDCAALGVKHFHDLPSGAA